MDDVTIRTIQPDDDKRMGTIIRDVLIEFNAAQTGTAFEDPYLFALSACYKKQDGVYYVAFINGELVGGCGIGPLAGVEDVCELQKMYLMPFARKRGIASRLLERCLQYAIEAGYQKCYLETLPFMQEAQKLYSKYGFERTLERMGNTGHFTCDLYMIKAL